MKQPDVSPTRWRPLEGMVRTRVALEATLTGTILLGGRAGLGRAPRGGRAPHGRAPHGRAPRGGRARQGSSWLSPAASSSRTDLANPTR